MSFRIILLWIGLGLSSLSFSQETYTVKGMIADSNDNTPIMGAYISLDDTTKLSSLEVFKKISAASNLVSVDCMNYDIKMYINHEQPNCPDLGLGTP